jgi:hypothetical protein
MDYDILEHVIHLAEWIMTFFNMYPRNSFGLMDYDILEHAIHLD